MKFIATAPDGLVLRDGKPFGEHGTHAGGFLDWPLPQTLAGMFRTAIGHQRAPDYFNGPEKEQNISSILETTLEMILPVDLHSPDTPSPLFPVPADLFFTDQKETLMVHQGSFETAKPGEGSLSPFNCPLICQWGTNVKPSSRRPFWLNQQSFLQYVNEDMPSSARPDMLGPTAPTKEDIQHNAISETGTSDDGRLYRNRNLNLSYKTDTGGEYPVSTPLGIYLKAGGLESSDTLPETAYLGGERRTVHLRDCATGVISDCPDRFQGQRFLKLVLATHGDFGSWAPKWMIESCQGDWVAIPGTPYRTRLRTALISRWQAVSGWDYALQAPKATRKLVPPGSVYLLECENPEQAPEIAKHFWGGTLCEGQPARDGFGICFVAKASASLKTLS